MHYLTFRSSYNAVHRLWSPTLTAEENLATFGECANRAGHGHLYRVEVTIGAPVDRAHPVALDRQAIERLIDDVLTPKLQNADMDTVFNIEGFISTGENVVRAIWDHVEPRVADDVTLVSIRVIETEKNSFTYYGGDCSRMPFPA